MSDQVVRTLTDPSFLIALLVAIAVFATVFTVLPALSGNQMKSRMKAVALEREELRAKQRARLAVEQDRRKRGSGLREEQSLGIYNIVERLDLRRALVDEATLAKMRTAGFRGQNPLTRFLFFRLLLPFVFAAVAIVYLFVLDTLPDQPGFVKILICVFAAYAGFYAPVLYVRNRAQKRMKSIQSAWPDALDLMLICVEAGMSVEAAFRKVSEEIGSQSVDLAEEFVLTNAELSFLQERRAAYDNLAGRTGLESVRSVAQALIQAERYGTPVAMALRVLAQESRDMRMNEAEKKAAALPPKLTVPMILFFVPVLFAVILGPAIMQALALKNGG
ncbi:MAG: type II secretion system F family protein [Mesorhizobium sp.]|jgi:tight adherence protein C